ncbi:DUF2795 domain-containing protein [Amycolatopsis sp. NPDC023774]|uniref:DUF2795 domain-containing protein n=1 Tax=Amycolatopsis sp. NPDC023774 TaxID=3155015 RepID=UPI0033EE05C7
MSFPDQNTFARHLERVAYPCGREDLLRHATAAGGSDDVLGPLGALAVDGRYDNFDSVWAALETNRVQRG